MRSEPQAKGTHSGPLAAPVTVSGSGVDEFDVINDMVDDETQEIDTSEVSGIEGLAQRAGDWLASDHVGNRPLDLGFVSARAFAIRLSE